MVDRAPIAVIAEHFGGALRPVAWELLGAAAELSTDVISIIVGREIEAMAAELAAAGVDVLAIDAPAMPAYNGEIARAALAGALAELRPSGVLLAHTTQGLDLAPALAARLDAACLTAVDGFAGGDEWLFRRAIRGGKLNELIRAAPPIVLTISPGAFARPAPAARPGVVRTKKCDISASRTRSLGLISAPAAADLTQADVVIAAGRGVKKREYLAWLADLAAAFPKSAVAGSRPLCDAGWLPYARQVGATGATVAPKLYLACGISGAAQHLAGMRGSTFVVAVNTDPHAAIFRAADVGVVEDLATFLPLLTAACRRRDAALITV